MPKEKNKKSKRKYPLLLMTIILFIYSYILFWFADELFPLVWLSCGICILIIPITWLINFIKSINYITKGYKNIKHYIPLLIIFITTFIFFTFNPDDMRNEYDYKRYYDERVEYIRIVELNNDIEKLTELPKKYKKISRTGKAYVYLNNENELLIGFHFDLSFPDGGSELVYSSGGIKLIKDNINDIYKIHQKDKNWFMVYFN